MQGTCWNMFKISFSLTDYENWLEFSEFLNFLNLKDLMISKQSLKNEKKEGELKILILTILSAI